MKSLGALLCLAAATACGGREPAERLAQPIFGGSSDPDDTAVVGVVNFAGGQCTGTLIAPQLVLTARHCVADTAGQELQVLCGKTAFDPPDSPGAIFIVAGATISDDPADYLAVSDIRLPEGSGDDLCGTDVALLRLAKPLTGVTPIEPRLAEAVVPGERYVAVGYGVDESRDGHPAGERLRLDGLEVSCAGSACQGADVRENEWIGARGACHGDSGGPALDDAGRVIGVVSRGASQCQSPVYGDVASRAVWLRSEAVATAALGREPPPSWACDGDACSPAAPASDEGPPESCSLSRRGVRGSGGWSLLAATALLLLRQRGSGRAAP